MPLAKRDISTFPPFYCPEADLHQQWQNILEPIDEIQTVLWFRAIKCFRLKASVHLHWAKHLPDRLHIKGFSLQTDRSNQHICWAGAADFIRLQLQRKLNNLGQCYRIRACSWGLRKIQIPVRCFFFIYVQYLSKISQTRSREDKIIPKTQVKKFEIDFYDNFFCLLVCFWFLPPRIRIQMEKRRNQDPHNNRCGSDPLTLGSLPERLAVSPMSSSSGRGPRSETSSARSRPITASRVWTVRCRLSLNSSSSPCISATWD